MKSTDLPSAQRPARIERERKGNPTAYAYRGRRVAYDNIAVGSISGMEKHISLGVSDVSPMGDAACAGAGGGSGDNIAVGSVMGVESYVVANKLTSDADVV